METFSETVATTMQEHTLVGVPFKMQGKLSFLFSAAEPKLC